jgi:hypothetical protein
VDPGPLSTIPILGELRWHGVEHDYAADPHPRPCRRNGALLREFPKRGDLLSEGIPHLVAEKLWQGSRKVLCTGRSHTGRSCRFRRKGSASEEQRDGVRAFSPRDSLALIATCWRFTAGEAGRCAARCQKDLHAPATRRVSRCRSPLTR